MVDLAAAYASCERDARAHYENFPVASILLPREMRRHIAAVYAFARAADDFADEGERTPVERCALLDAWRRRLERAVAGDHQHTPVGGEPANAPDIFAALGSTIREKRLPATLFFDLLSAFRQDVSVTRYATWQALDDYCCRSANPIGRLVLRIAGYHSEQLDRWSDAMSTALQLANFWQDVAHDYVRGRVYLPLKVLEAHGASADDLNGAHETPPAWRNALREAVERTRDLLKAGRPLPDAVSGRLRYELRATWLGATRVLSRLERRGFDPITSRPSLGAADVPWFAWRLLRWPS